MIGLFRYTKKGLLMFRGMTKFTCDVCGNNYYARGGIFGKRIMILGESHYCDECCSDCGNCH